MGISFVEGVRQINASKKPISTAWSMSCEFLKLDNKINKIIEIIKEHENLFVNRNFYHNQYHFAEVIWSTAWLCEEELKGEDLQEHALIAFLAATFHDVEHPGRSGKEPYELEKKSAEFFKQWWRNNSLFLESIMKTKPNDVEEIVKKIILSTDFIEGQEKVVNEYKENKEIKELDIKIVKIKNIIIEADILMSVLPQYGFFKTELLLKEAGKTISEDLKWNFWYSFLSEYGVKVFISDGAKKLKIPQMINALIIELEKEFKQNKGNYSETQKRLYQMFGSPSL